MKTLAQLQKERDDYLTQFWDNEVVISAIWHNYITELEGLVKEYEGSKDKEMEFILPEKEYKKSEIILNTNGELEYVELGGQG